MPLVTSYEWNGMPGIVCAAPQFQFFDVAYCSKVLEEAGYHLDDSGYEPDTPYVRHLVRANWERTKPWFMRYPY